LEILDGGTLGTNADPHIEFQSGAGVAAGHVGFYDSASTDFFIRNVGTSGNFRLLTTTGTFLMDTGTGAGTLTLAGNTNVIPATNGYDMVVRAGHKTTTTGEGGDMLLSSGNGQSAKGGDLTLSTGTGSGATYFRLQTGGTTEMLMYSTGFEMYNEAFIPALFVIGDSGDYASASYTVPTIKASFDNSTADASAAKAFDILGVNKTAGTGAGGAINIKSGTSSGGTPGALAFSYGSTEGMSLSGAGLVTLGASGGTQIHRINGATVAAAASTATLLTSPVAGEPALWAKINWSGTNYVFPLWTAP
jgi:hypothetical protein